MKKAKLTFMCVFIISTSLFAQIPKLEWAAKLSGPHWDHAMAIDVDLSGNSYTTGMFQTSGDFDPGPWVYTLNVVGEADIFISKLDAESNFVFAKNIGGTEREVGNAIRVDETGNIYLAGYFKGTVDFNPGPGVFSLISNGVEDIFILKLDSLGDFLWAKAIGGTGKDEALSLELDGLGGVFIAGYFSSNVDFNPDTIVNTFTSNGDQDIFILKLDTSGNYMWNKTIGGSQNDNCNSIAIDNLGNIYATGFAEGIAIDFDPGPGSYFLSTIYEDIFVIKLNLNGYFNWANVIGGYSQNDKGYAVTVDDFGNVFATGFFGNTVDFDPGTGINVITSAGNTDVYILKLDSSGNYGWAHGIGGTGGDQGYSIDLDTAGNIYTRGWFEETVDFDPGLGVNELNSINQNHFNLKLDASGNFLWAVQFGGNNYVKSGNLLKVDNSNYVYNTGYFAQTADFDPGFMTFFLQNSGADVFITKYSQTIHPIAAFDASSVNATISDAIQFTDHSENSPTSWYWDFGDGTSDTVQHPLHTFSTQGNFTITLIVSDGIESDTAIRENYVYVTESLFNPQFNWAGGFSNANQKSIKVDEFRNIYTSGDYINSCDFDPGPSNYNFTSNGFWDIFISKADSSGHPIWTKTIGGTDEDRGHFMTIDNFGNIYLTGTFESLVDFDPGPSIFNLDAGSNTNNYILKLDTAGIFQWAFDLGENSCSSIDFDSLGYMYITGLFKDTFDLDFGTTSYPLISTDASYDIFVAKYDLGFNLVWAKGIGGKGDEAGHHITTDNAFNILVTGNFNDTLDFDPGPGVDSLASNIFQDAFVLKLNPNGDFLWVNQLSGIYPAINGIETDSAGCIYSAGTFTGSGVDFDPGPGTYLLDAPSIWDWDSDAFILKYDPEGNFLWAHDFGGYDSEWGTDIAIDENGYPYITGIAGYTDFDPGPGVYYLQSNGDNAFFLKLNPNGDFVWAKGLQGAGAGAHYSAKAIEVDANGSFYAVGQFYGGIVDFDPDSGVYNLTPTGSYDSYILKLGKPSALTAQFSASSTTIILGDTINFFDESLGSPTSWQWDFGDGTTDTVALPIHIYQNPGIFTVSLIAERNFNYDTLTKVNYITVNAALLTSSSTTNVDCHGNATGSIDISLLNGNPPYSYLWSNGSTSEDLININAGTYTVSITDIAGWTYQDTFTITQPYPLFVPFVFDDFLCYGDSIPYYTPNTTGGTPPYTYNLYSNNPLDSTYTLFTGYYALTVTDANLCTESYSTTINQPDQLLFTENITHNQFMGDSLGIIELNPTGGTPPYSFDWSNGETTQTITGLPFGAYHLTVSDNNQCWKDTTYYIYVIAGQENELLSSDQTILYQNVPNPFSIETQISFYLQKAGQVSVDIYSVLGNKLITIHHGFMESGRHELSFKNEKLSSGTYYYSLKTTQARLTKKMIIGSKN